MSEMAVRFTTITAIALIGIVSLALFVYSIGSPISQMLNLQSVTNICFEKENTSLRRTLREIAGDGISDEQKRLSLQGLPIYPPREHPCYKNR